MTAPETITELELTPVHVPFKLQVRQAMASSEGGLGMAINAEEAWLGGDFVICRARCGEEAVGLAEAFVWLPETGVSTHQIIQAINGYLARYVIGENPFAVERMRHRMDANVARNEVAKGLLDMACYDLMGQLTGRPAHAFMGGKAVDEVPLAALVPLTDVDVMKSFAQMYQKMGYESFRYKLGRGIAADVEISEQLREVLGEAVRLRVDYNQAYTPPDAVRAIKAIEPFGIDFAEQPVAAGDYAGMAYVQQRVDTPLMAHEGFFSLRDFVTLVEMEAVGVLGINSERPGGVTNAIRALDYAEQRGLTAVLHNQPLGIASAMHVHLAAARHHSLGHATELFGHVMLEDDFVKEALDYSKGTAKVPDGPGWGVELEEAALEKYATGETVTITRG